jgi:hypothetical protein
MSSLMEGVASAIAWQDIYEARHLNFGAYGLGAFTTL